MTTCLVYACVYAHYCGHVYASRCLGFGFEQGYAVAVHITVCLCCSCYLEVCGMAAHMYCCTFTSSCDCALTWFCLHVICYTTVYPCVACLPGFVRGSYMSVYARGHLHGCCAHDYIVNETMNLCVDTGMCASDFARCVGM